MSFSYGFSDEIIKLSSAWGPLSLTGVGGIVAGTGVGKALRSLTPRPGLALRQARAQERNLAALERHLERRGAKRETLIRVEDKRDALKAKIRDMEGSSGIGSEFGFDNLVL